MSNVKGYIVDAINRLKPGESITLSKHLLRDMSDAMSPMAYDVLAFLNQPTSPVDQIMEQVVGSSYSIEYHVDLPTGNVTFKRLDYELPDGERTYVSPDRRHMYKQVGPRWKHLDIAN